MITPFLAVCTYYVGGLKDIEANEIHMIGEAKVRFKEDPVRMIRAIRFGEKLNAELSNEITRTKHDMH
jgi:poly(A) polymerase